MNTLKCDYCWLKLEACVAADADITKWIGTSASNRLLVEVIAYYLLLLLHHILLYGVL